MICEYIWIDGYGQLRSKARTCSLGEGSPPVWNFDGSSTGQAPGDDSEVLLIPVAVYPDPFRGGDSKLVLCDCQTGRGESASMNWRSRALAVFQKYEHLRPWYGLEQEYFIMEGEPTVANRRPLGWSAHMAPQGPYYCGVGTRHPRGREIAEEHYRLCLEAGLNVSGINAEVAPGQWEFQIGPCEGIEAGDQMWMARYILLRVAEREEGAGRLSISFDPKPLTGDWNGSGMHTNFSTEAMRKENGLDAIHDAINLLATRHSEHLEVYGSNEQRLTGLHETSSRERFTWGVGSRNTSVRIPVQVAREGHGYFEDRRPASDADPYQVTAIILETVAS